MAKTGEKSLQFPFSLDTLDFLEKLKKKINYVMFTLNVKNDKILINVKGTRESVSRAVYEIKNLFVSV